MKRFPDDIVRRNPLSLFDSELAAVLEIDTAGLIGGDLLYGICDESEDLLKGKSREAISRAIALIDEDFHPAEFDKPAAQARGILEAWLANLNSS